MAKKKVDVLIVTSSHEKFRRAGIGFTQEPKVLRVSDLKKEQIEAIKAERALSVKETQLDEDQISATEE